MPEMAYLNFDLEIEKAGDGYRAHVINSPAGEARAAMGPVAAAAPGASPQTVGGALFDALFRDDVLSSLRRSLDAAKRGGKGLRLRMRLAEVPELAGLPWELLYDRQSATFFALSRETPLVRYLDLPEAAEDIEPEIKLRVLAVIASPSDYPPLDVEQEWKNLKEGLADLEANGVVTVDRLQPTTVDALQKQLLKQEYHILHFLGHGDYSDDSKDGVLLLTAADGKGDAVSGETFSALLRDQNSLRLALISACRGAVSGEQDPYSGVAQRLVRGGVPAVIAMRSSISDPAAVALAHSFYAALATGAAVDEAVAEARKTLYSGGFPNDWATAVLYMRAADGHLWRPETKTWWEKWGRKAVTIAVPAVVLLLVAGFLWWRSLPTKMGDSPMNIVVLDPGTARPDGTFAQAPSGNLARSWMVTSLISATVPAGERVGLWHNGLGLTQKRDALPVLQGQTQGDREGDASALAKKLNADIVVTGRVTETVGADRVKWEMLPEFYVVSRVKSDAGETIGYYTLGKPIVVSGNPASDRVSRNAVVEELNSRMELLGTVLLALQDDTIGNHDQALKLLQGLEAKLAAPTSVASLQPAGNTASASTAVQAAPPANDQGFGLDILYYFVAREELFLQQNLSAEADARRALDINDSNVRAHIVLGGALLNQSRVLVPQLALQPEGLQDQAEAEYKAAFDLAGAAHDQALAKGAKSTPVFAIAQLGRGQALITRGLLLYRQQTPATDAEADKKLNEALGYLNPAILEPLENNSLWRMVAQYYAAVGSAKLMQGVLAATRQDTGQARTFYKEAQAQFQACTDQLGRMNEDKTLRDAIIAAGCTPGLKQVEQQLTKLGG